MKKTSKYMVCKIGKRKLGIIILKGKEDDNGSRGLTWIVHQGVKVDEFFEKEPAGIIQ